MIFLYNFRSLTGLGLLQPVRFPIRFEPFPSIAHEHDEREHKEQNGCYEQGDHCGALYVCAVKDVMLGQQEIICQHRSSVCRWTGRRYDYFLVLNL